MPPDITKRNLMERIWPEDRYQRGATIFFALIALTWGVTTFVNAALIYDGAFSLFRLLDRQFFVADLDRMINVPIQLPALSATFVTNRLGVLSRIFSGAYCAVPCMGLGLSWLLCRRHPSLFVWPAFSICLAELPGRFFFTNEQVMLATLFWPALLTAIFGASTLVLAMVSGITIFAAASQPVAAPTLALIMIAAIATAIIKPEVRTSSLWFGLFIGLLLLERVTVPLYDWETSSLTIATVYRSFYNAVYGWPLIATILTLAAGVTCLFRPVRYTRALLFAELAGVGVALTIWAWSPATWWRLIDFRYWATPIALALMSGAVIEELWLRRSEAQLQEIRAVALPIVGAIFLIVLSMQSIEWQMMNHRLRDELASSGAGCVPVKSFNWIRRTPLAHWGGAFSAVENQGRMPTTLMLPSMQACESFAADGDAKFVDRGTFNFERGLQGRYFDFEEAYLN